MPGKVNDCANVLIPDNASNKSDIPGIALHGLGLGVNGPPMTGAEVIENKNTPPRFH